MVRGYYLRKKLFPFATLILGLFGIVVDRDSFEGLLYEDYYESQVEKYRKKIDPADIPSDEELGRYCEDIWAKTSPNENDYRLSCFDCRTELGAFMLAIAILGVITLAIGFIGRFRELGFSWPVVIAQAVAVPILLIVLSNIFLLILNRHKAKKAAKAFTISDIIYNKNNAKASPSPD